MKEIFKVTVWDNSKIYNNRKSYPNCFKKYHVYGKTEEEAHKKVMAFVSFKRRQDPKNFVYGEIICKTVKI